MTEGSSNKIALVFPGQGAQKPGMGADFFKAYSESAEIFDRASKVLDLDMQELCFTENERVNLTEYTQPAILTVEIAMLAALKKEFSLAPTFYGGHSLGEYTALVAAGAIPFEDCLKIVRKRGALMQQAVPEGIGAMAALIGDKVNTTAILDLVRGCGAEVANYNSTAQVVISGEKPAVEATVKRIESAHPDVKAIFLNVSAPFHSTLMRVIEAEFEIFIRSFEHNFCADRSKYVLSNFLGEFHQPDSLVQNLVSQISGSVRWVQNMKTLAAMSSNILELGPNKVLNRFFSSIDVSIKSIFDMRSMDKAMRASGAST